MAIQKNDSRYMVKSLNKALEILDLLSIRPELGLQEITNLTGIDKTSVFKFLYTFERRGYVVKTPDSRYRIGSKIVSYGQTRMRRSNIVDIATPLIHDLCLDTKETVTLAILNANGRCMNLYSERGSTENSVPSRIGLEFDAYTVPMGKVLLAYQSKNMLNVMLRDVSFHSFTENTIMDINLLYRDFEQIRLDGYSIDNVSQWYHGRTSLAAPVFDNGQNCVAAVALVCGSDNMQEHQDFYLNRVCETAKEITAKLNEVS